MENIKYISLRVPESKWIMVQEIFLELKKQGKNPKWQGMLMEKVDSFIEEYDKKE